MIISKITIIMMVFDFFYDHFDYFHNENFYDFCYDDYVFY